MCVSVRKGTTACYFLVLTEILLIFANRAKIVGSQIALRNDVVNPLLLFTLGCSSISVVTSFTELFKGGKENQVVAGSLFKCQKNIENFGAAFSLKLLMFWSSNFNMLHFDSWTRLIGNFTPYHNSTSIKLYISLHMHKYNIQ